MLDILAHRRNKNKEKFNKSLEKLIKDCYYYEDGILIDNDINLIDLFINKLKIKLGVSFINIKNEKDEYANDEDRKYKVLILDYNINSKTYTLCIEDIFNPDFKNFLMYIDKNFFKINYGLQSNKVINPKIKTDVMRNLLNKKSHKKKNTLNKCNIRRVPKV